MRDFGRLTNMTAGELWGLSQCVSQGRSYCFEDLPTHPDVFEVVIGVMRREAISLMRGVRLR